MKTLFLARHAKSSWNDPSIDDFDRPLNKRGQRDGPVMAGAVARLPDPPELIVSSPAARAAATARFYAEALGIREADILWDPALYGASAAAILGVAAGIDDRFARAMIVGHNPGMTQAASDLCPGAVAHMPTCSVAAIDLPAASWTAVRAGSGTLRFFRSPKSTEP